MSVMAQHAASPPLADSRAGTVYLVLDDFSGLGCAYRETDAAQADPKPVVADLSYPINIGIPCAWWRSTSPRMSAQTSRERFALVRELEQELPAAVRAFVERVCA
jgi:hypothetical protein